MERYEKMHARGSFGHSINISFLKIVLRGKVIGYILCFRLLIIVITLGILCLVATWTARGAETEAPHAPWPIRDDGRVELIVQGHRITFDPNTPEGDITFDFLSQNGLESASLSRILTNPEWARRKFEESSVRLRLINSRSAPGRFLARFSRNSIPNITIFWISLYGDRSTTDCNGPSPPSASKARICDRFRRLAFSDDTPLNDAGLIEDRLEDLRGLDSVAYIIPVRERLSATGEPIYLFCNRVLPVCGTNTSPIVFGYFVLPGVRLGYQFRPGPSGGARMWRDVDARLRAVVADLFQTTNVETLP
ncbi:hypothetical protein C8P66_1582 [Humitalea rosea]|uniref:Uncharacterized protein n=1 Tax=Humitalea rosea TaxID=990373 RepID=A0A2W7JR62_9PROT|nr:hypothetical protein C8P66_1582 [Humitalea rosea]